MVRSAPSFRLLAATVLLFAHVAAAHAGGAPNSGSTAHAGNTSHAGSGAHAPQGSTEAIVRAAETQLAAGDRDAALQTAESALRADPLNVPAHHVIQRILRRDAESAMLARYAELARRYPGSAAAQYLYGNALLNASEGTGASGQFARALELDPTFGWAAALQAAFAQIRGDTELALRLLAPIDVLQIRGDLTASAVYADLLRLNGLRGEAIAFLEQAAAVNPEDPRFLLELWRMRMRGADDWQAERAAFAWQVAANRERFLASPDLAAELAQFYKGSAMGDPAGSRDVWLALANRFPANPEAKNALLRAAGMTNDTEERIGLYERILTEYPDSPIRYQVYYDMLNDLIEREEYERAKRIARALTTAIDPGLTEGPLGQFEEPTPWGFTLQGIGFAGWFAAAQGDNDAGTYVVYSAWGTGTTEQPISPDALAAARAMDASDCHDPHALRYVAQFLLESSFHRVLGIRLMERAERAARGADPLTELAYGTDNLEEAREELERHLRRMPIYYVLAGMTAEAELAVERMLAELSPRPGSTMGSGDWETHYVAGRVFAIIGRWREAARHYLIATWDRPSIPRNLVDDFLADLARIYAEIGSSELQRFAPGTGPRLPVMRAGLAPVEGAASLDAEALGGDLLLVVFWANWNDASIAHVLAADALALELEGSAFSMLAVAVERSRPFRSRGTRTDQFALFRERHDLTIPMAAAELGAIDRLDLVGLPTTMLLDRTGRVLARQFGFDADRATWSQEWRAVVRDELERIGRAQR
jgi:tetratricopeptide (TPR) repeat protein